MYFVSDTQTTIDLSTVEGYYGERSLFSLFNVTESDRGRQLLYAWIDKPLNDLKAIRERQEAIRTQLPELMIDQEELDFIEYYLNLGDVPTRYSSINSFFRGLLYKLHTDPRQYVIKRGCELIKQVLKRLGNYLMNMPDDVPVLVKSFVLIYQEAFEITELKGLFSNNHQNQDIDYCDYLFRYKRSETIRRLLDIIYHLDVIQAVRKVGLVHDFCYPNFSEQEPLYLKEFYHPLLKNAVRNDWTIGQGNICLFTGSNMSGKSTTLRAIASIVWLAHVGFPVPATQMICPIFDAIFTSINLPDSMKDGRSHFYAEVLRVKEILKRIVEGKRCFILFDELFRGTNAGDALEASVAVLDILKKQQGSVFLISTHILELARHFQSDVDCSFYYLESKIEDEELVCSHRLMNGISESRVGYWIVNKELSDL